MALHCPHRHALIKPCASNFEFEMASCTVDALSVVIIIKEDQLTTKSFVHSLTSQSDNIKKIIRGDVTMDSERMTEW